MPLAAFLKLPDIDGESKSAEHEDEIDLYDIAWQVTQEPETQIGSGRARARAVISPLYVYKWYDAASPYIALAAMQGKTIDEAVITLRKDSGDAHLDYLRITLTNALVSHYEILGEFEESHTPNERVGLAFERIKVLYIVQAEDHSEGDEHEIEYDLASGIGGGRSQILRGPDRS
jgi:type VI secretion system secreted protein Hcp